MGWTLVVELRLEGILFGGQHGETMPGMRTNTGQRSADINLFLEDFHEEGSSKGFWEVWLHRIIMVMLWEGEGSHRGSPRHAVGGGRELRVTLLSLYSTHHSGPEEEEQLMGEAVA